MIELDVEDIKEAAECIRRSRKIIMALRDANEFEENFIKVKSKIPKTFFQSSKVNNSMIEKVMIFTLNHITKRKSQSKHVKQFLKKNASLCAFAVSLDVVIQKLTDLGVLNTQVSIKRRRILNDLHGFPRQMEVFEVEQTVS